ncbi:twin-arginine translocase TatA/TatE family subunit [Azospirillum sp.]|uniref:twin-arginine translocase TatA/TatE family subunit n=1 Tax=Azospirillum sp. TaxID=34012 RepID=UPI003D7507FD
MGFTSIWHWIIVLLIVLLLFGAGKLPKVMGDLAKGIKNFKAGLKDDSDDEAPAQPAATVTPLPNQAAAPVVPPVAPTSAPAAAPGTDPGLKKDETART